MMTDMHKERVKSEINPIIAVVVWLVGMYAFTILWGIAEILFEFELNLPRQICSLLITAGFGWFFISKIMTEYEFEVGNGKFTVTKILARRRAVVMFVATDNIKAFTEDKDKLNKLNVEKVKSYVRAGQKGKTVYIIYKNGDRNDAIKLKTTSLTKKHLG